MTLWRAEKWGEPRGGAATARAARSWLVAPLLLGLGMFLLSVAWAGGNPPGASPDEPDNYVKTVATGRFELAGGPYVGDTSSLGPLASRWYQLTGRSYELPAELAPTRAVTCFQFDAEKSASCQDDPRVPGGAGTRLLSSAQGTYEPVLYFAPGVAALGSGSFYEAQLRARVANAVLAGIFVAWAAVLVHRRARSLVPLAGVALAVTPMVLFLSASVGTGGVETAAALCVWAALTQFWRSPAAPNGGAWVALTVAGPTLALARMVDPVFIAVMLACMGALMGLRQVRKAIGSGGRRARWAIILVSLGAVFTVAWDAVVMPHPPFSLSLARDAVVPTLGNLPNHVRQIVGIFGWNDTSMPQVGYVLWLAMMVTLLAAALMRGQLRERAVLLGLMLAAAALDVGIAVGLEAQIGFGMQSRYLLPVAVGIPVLAAEVVERRWRPGQMATRGLGALLLIGVAVLQLMAWGANARRYSVGVSGPWLTFWRQGWAPVAGWTLWGCVAVTGAVLIVASSVAGSWSGGHQGRSSSESPPHVAPATDTRSRPGPTGSVVSRTSRIAGPAAIDRGRLLSRGHRLRGPGHEPERGHS